MKRANCRVETQSENYFWATQHAMLVWFVCFSGAPPNDFWVPISIPKSNRKTGPTNVAAIVLVLCCVAGLDWKRHDRFEDNLPFKPRLPSGCQWLKGTWKSSAHGLRFRPERKKCAREQINMETVIFLGARFASPFWTSQCRYAGYLFAINYESLFCFPFLTVERKQLETHFWVAFLTPLFGLIFETQTTKS